MNGGVQYVGEFTPTERAFLDTQFSGCCFELIARSARDPQLALLRWRALGPALRRVRVPPPLFWPPSETFYVLDSSGPREPRLQRIDQTKDLDSRYPQHFPGIEIRRSGLRGPDWIPAVWERLWRRSGDRGSG